MVAWLDAPKDQLKAEKTAVKRDHMLALKSEALMVELKDLLSVDKSEWHWEDNSDHQLAAWKEHLMGWRSVERKDSKTGSIWVEKMACQMAD